MDLCLILNVGSSSLKWTALREDDSIVAEGNDALGGPDAESLRAVVEQIAARLPRCSAVGHRIVHGGSAFRESVRIGPAERQTLERLVALDPLHMRPALSLLDAARGVLSDVPHVAAFDTAFHRTMPAAAAGFAVPRAWEEQLSGDIQLRRYGFHGLSVEWSIGRARDVWGALPARVLVAHLGSGCSVTAVREGHSVDTTMGFTPLDGLMMATRSGAIDPGLILFLQEHCGFGAQVLREGLTQQSGLLGVSGFSGDLREVLASADRGDAHAKLAYERFIVYGRRALGAMAGALGGVDGIIFTGGIGEHSARVRADLARFAGEGLIDPQLNDAVPDAHLDAFDIGAASNRVLVVRAREDLIIARDVRRLAAAA